MRTYLLKKHKMSKEHIKEIVIYRIKPQRSKDFMEKGLPELRQIAKGFTGMVSHTTHQCVGQPELFIDVVEWESLHYEEEAAKQMDAKMKAGEAPNMIDTYEKTEFFNHFKIIH